MSIEKTEQVEKKMPERKKSFVIGGNTYTTEFPNTGGLIEIEIIKANLTSNQYLSFSNASYAKYLVDMIAVFNVLFPELKKDMNVKAISELNPLDSKKLLTVYIKEVLPWMNEWYTLLNSDDEE